jgi:DNA invertase Pin-like site-specific DNA recombinase
MSRKITKLEIAASMPDRKSVAAYARVSCGTDEMLHSLAAQVSFYSELIQSNPEWEYAGVYADAAETGTKDSRPEFKRLIADCKDGLIDRVITKSISRFARNTVTLLETVRELKTLGIGVYFEEENTDTLSADGELMLTILASYAQEESRSVSENQKWRIRKSYSEGRPSNNLRIYGYDYNAGAFTIIPEEAEVVRMIFDDYLSGLGRNAIMKKLVSLGIPTKLGGRWAESTVGSILRNEKYLGDICLQKGFIADHMTKLKKPNRGELPKFYIEGNHEAIISRDVFEAVQAEMARRAVKTHRSAQPALSEFSGIIRCGRCGATFRKKVSGSTTKYAKVVWSCATYVYRGKHECAIKRISEDILKAKCAEALGLAEHDPDKFTSKVAAITVPNDGVMIFTFKDGSERTLTWKNPSRSKSWTDEMKQAARERRMGGADNG